MNEEEIIEVAYVETPRATSSPTKIDEILAVRIKEFMLARKRMCNMKLDN